MKLLMCLLNLISLNALAQTDDLPKMMLGRGFAAFYDSAASMKNINRIFKENGREPLYTQDQIAEVKAKKNRSFVGMECVGHNSLGELNCFKVQAVWIDLTEMKVVQRGKVLLVGDFNPSTTRAQPTEKELKTFLRELKANYLDYSRRHLSKGQKATDVGIAALGVGTFIFGLATLGTSAIIAIPVVLTDFAITEFLARKNLHLTSRSELTDTSGFNWSSQPRKVSPKTHEMFRSFVMQYDQPVGVTDSMIEEFKDIRQPLEEIQKKVNAEALAAKQQLIDAPYPIVAQP